ncbi:MAG: hypothetical protein AB7O78_07555 [Thermoleophilia bacterium]
MSTAPAEAPAPDAGASARRLPAVVRLPVVLETVAVLAGFGLLAVFMTWPVALDFGTKIPGAGGGGDASGYVWDLWFNATHGLRLWGTSVQETVSAPFGRELPGSANATLLTTVGPAWFVARIWSPIVAYNTAVMSGVALTGASMYLLVRWLRLGVFPAIWAGAAFALFPYETIRVFAHVPLTHLECVPLTLMAGLYWLRAPGWRRAFLVAAALAFAWLTNPYYGFMCMVVIAVIGLWGVVAAVRASGWRPAAAVAGRLVGAAALVVGVPLLALFASSRGAVEGVFTRDPVELLLYGARVSDYVKPLGNSAVWDEVFGSPFPSPSGERLNYVGLTTIALAVLGVTVALLARRTRVEGPRRTAALIAIPLVPVLVLFSLASPTTVFGHPIDMPSRLVFEVAPFLRAFARFVVPTIAVLLVAGAVGLWWLMRGRGDVARIAIGVTALLLMVADLPAPMPLVAAQPVVIEGRTADQIPTWAWLRDHDPGATVFEMPGTPNELIERYYMYGQTVHGHDITNGGLFAGQIGQDFTRQAGMPQWPNTARWLRSLGIDLVTVSPWAYRMAGLPVPDFTKPRPGYALAAAFPDGSAVWRVTAEPADAVPVFRTGWWAAEFLPDRRIWRWMNDEGTITIVAPAPGTYRMTMRMRAKDDVPHRLEIEGPDGSRTRVEVGAEREVSVPVTLDGTRGDVVIRNLGPPAEQIAPGDLRIVSVQVDEPELTALAPGEGQGTR